MPQIIVNADDFGRSPAVNAGVLRAHREGILTSASLMVTGDAVDEAVSIAKQTPSLAVGLHVVAACGRAALPHARLPHITREGGHFSDDAPQAGWQYFHSHAARRELASELEAQFKLFADTGLPLSHVDGHLNIHVHPTVFQLLMPLAERFRARGFRLPRDDFGLALRQERRDGGTRATRAITFALLCCWCRSRLRRTRLRVVDRVYGLLQSGRMHESYLLRILTRLRVPAAEMYLHPSTAFEGDAFGPNPDDLQALLSPAVREALRDGGHRLSTYSSLDPVACG